MRKQTTEARVWRRAPAVPAVVAGPPVSAVSATCPGAHAARRPWGQRWAPAGPQGVRERARSGRPAHRTCARAPPLQRRVAQAPLEHGSRPAPGRGRTRATVLTPQTGVHRGRARGRGVCQTRREAPAGPLAGSHPPRRRSPMARSGTRRPGVPGPSRGERLALCSRHERGALGPAPAGRVAPPPAVSSAPTPAAPGPEPTASKSPTAAVGAVPRVASPHARRGAPGHRRRPGWPGDRRLANRAAW